MKKNLLENIHRTITFNNIKINSNLMKEKSEPTPPQDDMEIHTKDAQHHML